LTICKIQRVKDLRSSAHQKLKNLRRNQGHDKEYLYPVQNEDPAYSGQHIGRLTSRSKRTISNAQYLDLKQCNHFKARLDMMFVVVDPVSKVSARPKRGSAEMPKVWPGVLLVVSALWPSSIRE
jgi:hypothetical protein